MDANNLFENHSVDEVRDIEKKVRHDIEWKKEEMRDLVGERYRDLISAADTIKQMKLCAEKIGQRLTMMNNQCQKLRDTKTAKPASEESLYKTTPTLRPGVSEQKAIYEIACEIKLLLAVPGKIWSYLDNSDYLPAAKLYLLSKHVHNCLQYDTQTGGQVLGKFPVIAKQWSAISHFKSAILQGCRRTLSDYTESNVNIANAACSIFLLEDKTPRQVFQDFLVFRMYTGRGVSGVRNHINNAVQLIHNTVYQLTAVFCDSQPAGLGDSNILAESLSGLLQRPLLDQLGISEFSSLSKHLPRSVTGYQPTLRVQNVSLSEDYLKSSCDKWIQSCLDNVRQNVKEQLGYVTTVKSVTSLKEMVWDSYKQDARMKCWAEVCGQVFSKSLNLWLDEISPLFTTRVQEIIAEHFGSILAATETQLVKSKELILSARLHAESDVVSKASLKETDISSFIWCESANDMPSMDNWVTSAQKTFQDGGGLLMKAYSFTPVVQSLCNRLNQSLVGLLSEVEAYRQPQEVNPDIISLLSNQHSISLATADYMSQESFQAVSRLSDLVRLELQTYTNKDHSQENNDVKLSKPECSWILLLARFCSAIPKLCPHLEKCVLLQSASQLDASLMRKSMTMSMSRSYSKQMSIDPLWSQTTDVLAETSLICYRAWLSYTVGCISNSFTSAMAVDDIISVLQNITRWDDVEIQEDAEDGKTVKSIISVPMQVTWCLQNALNELCAEINRVGSHSLSRPLQTELVSRVLLAILEVYKVNVDGSMGHVTQAVALQYLFDIWYLSGLLIWRDTPESVDIERICGSLTQHLQGLVDPFDLDVFTPHMQKHVAKQRSRNLVLFGAIADTEKVMSTASRQSHSGRSEQHNVLPLHTLGNARFPLLPVMSESARASSQAMANNKSTGSTSKGQATSSSFKAENPSLSKLQSEPVMKLSSSFYDRIGSGAMSWFTGGVGGSK